ncbi:hypothetical protein CKM354_001134200 [Cercospora kikuchii]|uniref:Uncharacterized protein n=1 Tax=Cercospora kikuchii TaxID=84275 RepID=A0A9P3CST5_9PEZI|nr:uncharacterized protein CKM354_001134200 [Cercospora kikuchii]GIZ48274.1 hypothetical protein CKM354_001134200 [Cercospora kikuchii]
MPNAADEKYIDRHDDVTEQDQTLNVDVDQIVAVCLAMTVIGGAMELLFGEVEIKGPDQRLVDEQLAAWPSSKYRENGIAIATVVLAWLGFAFIASSTVVMQEMLST